MLSLLLSIALGAQIHWSARTNEETNSCQLLGVITDAPQIAPGESFHISFLASERTGDVRVLDSGYSIFSTNMAGDGSFEKSNVARLGMITDNSANELMEIVAPVTQAEVRQVSPNEMVVEFTAARNNKDFLFERRPGVVINTILGTHSFLGRVDHYIPSDKFGLDYEVVGSVLDLSRCGHPNTEDSSAPELLGGALAVVSTLYFYLF